MRRQQPSRGAAALVRGNACLQCRARKHKCDAGRPCGPCTKSGKSARCAYDASKSRMSVLEDRLQELQSSIKALESHRSRNGTSPPRSSSSSDESLEQDCVSSHWTRLPLPGAIRVVKHAAPRPAPIFLENPMDILKLPPATREHLVDMFITDCSRFSLILDETRFRQSLTLLPSHENAPHPALINALILRACTSPATPIRQYEPIFHERLHRSLTDSLSKADRLLDFVRASALTAYYYYGKNRWVEGHHHLSSTIRFAAGCGLHAIPPLSAVIRPNCLSMLNPPHDLLELGERINTFWMLFCLDRLGSIFTGLPISFPDEAISTPWPCPPEYFRDGRVQLSHSSSIASLYDMNHTPLYLSADDIFELRPKSIALLHRAVMLAERVKSRSFEDMRMEVFIAKEAAVRFAESLPPYRNTGDDNRNSIFICLHTTAQAAVIMFLGLFPEDNRGRQLQAARAALQVLKEINDAEVSNLCCLFAWTLGPIYDAVAQAVVSLEQADGSPASIPLRLELAVVLHLARALSVSWPCAKVLSEKIERFLSEGVDTGIMAYVL
ncbi:hypothetical protein BOTBODRAFT_354104 [Botryobasidium botryosum FD-172 SS1]|uniref:Zn(2)-C6 fungal-type domain-containing protein n=1 Tax=Botryobasidium botryosum (strain FD-172 SS1) TaxID=930990 RepID=A0A067MRK7_BOTB1|nr:hypothetical protein BOTBODRAFT_354104 [Botryobasidium botryosum FD-172 SS1]